MTNQMMNCVPRELLESFAAYVSDSPNTIMRARVKELRALLDKTEADIPASVSPGEPVAQVVLGQNGLATIELFVDFIPVGTYLYEQPAPVAAELPELARHLESVISLFSPYDQEHVRALVEARECLNSGSAPGVLMTGRRHIPAGIESLAQEIYRSWESQAGWQPWTPGASTQRQDEARQIASRTFELAIANQVGD